MQFTNMRDMARAFARSMNLISAEVANHHEKVAYFACRLAEVLGFSEKEVQLTLYGALLHDIGAITMQQDFTLADVEANASFLAMAGSALLRMHPATRPVADIVGSSQTPWRSIRNLVRPLRAPVLIGQAVHLADAVSLLLDPDKPVLNQVDNIRKCLTDGASGEFSPEVLKALDELCQRDYVWMDILYQPERFLEFIPADQGISLDEALRMTELVSHMIDFRSPFTAMHSAGVAASAESLARLAGMSSNECKMMHIAGNLHDLGKLKVPRDILEKPASLTDEEFNIVKEHAYYTYTLLREIRGFEQISAWAAFHHEKLSGKGYPFRLRDEDISFGSRIMAVADIFSAVTEDRPYRSGMSRKQAVAVLREQAAGGGLSASLVELLIAHYGEINAAREEASRTSGKRYYASLNANA